MKRARHSITALVAALSLHGCATSPVMVRVSHVVPAPRPRLEDPPGGRARPTLQTPVCSVHFASLKDSREDPAFLGKVGDRRVLVPGEGAMWIQSMLSTGLESKGVRLLFTQHVTKNPELVIPEVRLVKAWVGNVATSMRGTVVVAVRFNESREETVYRGASTDINWASTEGEIQTILDEAFDEMLTKLSIDLKQKCVDQGAPSSSQKRPE